MNKARTIPIAIVLAVSCFGYSQERTELYSDDDVKVYFKPFDETYGYVIDEFYNVYSLTLVNYWIDGNSFHIKETDTVIILDSMVYYSEGFGNHSDQISLRFRVNEKPGMELTMSKLTYLINDSTIHQDERITDDIFHRAHLETYKEPFELKVNIGFREIGPFNIKGNNTGKPRNLDIKLLLLMTSSYYESDLKTLMPKNFTYKGKEYKLRAEFLE